MADGEAVAATARGARALADYVKRPGWCDGTVSTYYGPQTTHAFMERTTWHAAQHLRQIYWFLDEMGVPRRRAADRRRPGRAADPAGGLVVAAPPAVLPRVPRPAIDRP